MMGLRADTTPQVARIDAHLLNRRASRACATAARCCTPARPPHATREPLQFGAEIYGHAGLEADLEALLLALDCLKATKVDAHRRHGRRAHRARAAGGRPWTAAGCAQSMRRWPPRTPANWRPARAFPRPHARRPGALISLYGDAKVLAEARKALPDAPAIAAAGQT
jgi:ATP phosphoribosyltransferase regulatory subunit